MLVTLMSASVVPALVTPILDGMCRATSCFFPVVRVVGAEFRRGLPPSFTQNSASSLNKPSAASGFDVTTTWPQLLRDHHEHTKPSLQNLPQKFLLLQILGVCHIKYSLNFVLGTPLLHHLPWVWWKQNHSGWKTLPDH